MVAGAMRILIDARYLDGSYSGIATYSRCLVEHLARLDQENEYLVVVRPGFSMNLQVGDNFEFLSYRPRPISLQSYLRFDDYVKEIQPDIVHSLAPHIPVFHHGPVMVTVHDLQPFVDPDFSAKRPRPLRAVYNLFYRWAYPTTMAKAKWIVCDSQATRDDVARLIPAVIPKLIVVRPGLEARPEKISPERTEAIRNKLGISERFFLYFGSTRPNKNLPNLVKAFARFLRENDHEGEEPRLVLVVRKDRFFRDVSRAISSRKLQDRVTVVDPLPRAEQFALLSGALGFVFPSKYEGFGFPPLEAMQAGVPVLAGRSGALPEILGEDAALLVDPEDVDDIAQGLGILASDGERRQALIEAGQAQIERFDWQECAGQIHDIYRLLF